MATANLTNLGHVTPFYLFGSFIIWWTNETGIFSAKLLL